MTRPILLSATAAVAIATAAPAKAPQFETVAPIAYLLDLSSGAELLAKNADQRMPPASMAKMMTTEVAFELIDRGQLPMSKTCTVRPETWRGWHGPQAGSTMFLSVNEQVSVENLLHGIVTLSGNDASVVLTEYGVRMEIPARISLPCGGTGVVYFFARPFSATARTITVQVTFVAQY